MSTQKSERNSDNFIMLPTVDFCFKELMQNPKVRKGFIAAILGKAPEMIRRTTLLPTALRKESEEDKLGILDVLVELEDGSKMNMEMQVSYFDCWKNRVLFYLGKVYTGQIKEGEDYDKLRKCIHVSILDFVHFPMDKKCFRKIVFCDSESGEQYTDLMELHILELKKLPPEDQSEDGIIRWMRFLRGKSRKEFEKMAKKDEYIEEAYNELKKLSLDEQKRLEYELRQKAVRDHNMMMKSAEKRGLEIGEKRGLEIGEKRGLEIGEKRGLEIGEKRGEKRGIEIGKKQGERIALKRIVENQMKAGKTAEETAELLGLDPQEVKELTEE